VFWIAGFLGAAAGLSAVVRGPKPGAQRLCGGS